MTLRGVSPLTIDIMLLCFYSNSPEDNMLPIRWNSPAAMMVRGWLRDEDLIDDENRATDRGKLWVEAICSARLPEKS